MDLDRSSRRRSSTSSGFSFSALANCTEQHRGHHWPSVFKFWCQVVNKDTFQTFVCVHHAVGLKKKAKPSQKYNPHKQQTERKTLNIFQVSDRTSLATAVDAGTNPDRHTQLQYSHHHHPHPSLMKDPDYTRSLLSSCLNGVLLMLVRHSRLGWSGRRKNKQKIPTDFNLQTHSCWVTCKSHLIWFLWSLEWGIHLGQYIIYMVGGSG